jgi:hypothetical protein
MSRGRGGRGVSHAEKSRRRAGRGLGKLKSRAGEGARDFGGRKCRAGFPARHFGKRKGGGGNPARHFGISKAAEGDLARDLGMSGAGTGSLGDISPLSALLPHLPLVAVVLAAAGLGVLGELLFQAIDRVLFEGRVADEHQPVDLVGSQPCLDLEPFASQPRRERDRCRLVSKDRNIAEEMLEDRLERWHSKESRKPSTLKNGSAKIAEEVARVGWSGDRAS